VRGGDGGRREQEAAAVTVGDRTACSRQVQTPRLMEPILRPRVSFLDALSRSTLRVGRMGGLSMGRLMLRCPMTDRNFSAGVDTDTETLGLVSEATIAPTAGWTIR
jgi:hypothetical protein